MNTRNLLSFLVTAMAFVFVFTIATPFVSAFANINEVVVNGVEFDDFDPDPTAGVFAGDTIGVRVVFTADDDLFSDVEEDVRIVARILGEPGLSEVTERFDVVEGSTYSRLLNIKLPFDLNDNLNEPFVLEVSVESNSAVGDSIQIKLEVQRENELIEILSVQTEDEVEAGESIFLDVVVKNRGRNEAEDTFIRASIPALGVSKLVFLGDLSPIDQGGNVADKEDSALGRIFLKIPKDATPGVYNVEIEAFDEDSTTLATRKVVVVGSNGDSNVIASTSSKTFAVGVDQPYTLTIVNADDKIQIYELVLETTGDLSISLDESVVAVPAGSSKTVKLTVRSNEEGTFNFAVNVHSEGELVEKQNFVANVEGRASAGNAAIVLTIILAIIFIVLLIVLIVLLTRKPEKTEDFGESYY